MIQELKNIKPFVSFGFGVTKTEVNTNTPITVWVDTLYNQDEFEFFIGANGATVNKISNYEYILTYATTGYKEVVINVGTKDKQLNLRSNTLIVTVI